MALHSLSNNRLWCLPLILGVGLLAGCGSSEIADNASPESTGEQPQATATTKTYIETFLHEGIRVQAEEGSDIASLIKASNGHAMTILSTHLDNYIFSPYEEAQTLAMLAVGTGTGPVQSNQSLQTTQVPVVLLDKDGSPLVDENGNIIVVVAINYTTTEPGSDVTETETYIPGEGDHPLHEAMNSWDQQLQRLINPAIRHRNSSLWGHENYLFLSSYLDTMAKYYGPEMSALSFMTDVEGSTQTISDWLDTASGKELIPLMTYDGNQIGERTRVVTLNTETMKAEWPGLFDASLTTDERFKMLDGTMKLVPTMHTIGTFNATETDQYQAFQLPFKNSTLVMLVIMPKEGEFENIQNQLNASPLLEQIIAALQPVETTLHLPRFSIETSEEITPPSDSTEGYGSFYDVNGQGYLLLKQKVAMATIDITEGGINAHAGGKSILDATADEPISVWNPSFTPPPSWYSLSATMTGPTDQPCYYQPQSRPFMFVVRETTTSTMLYAGTWTTPDSHEMEPDWMASGWQSCEEALNTPIEIISSEPPEVVFELIEP